MKILIIAYPFPPFGGMSRRNVYFANYLVDKGHSVDVLAAMPSRKYHGYDVGLLQLIRPNVRIYRTFAGIIHHLGYRYKIFRKRMPSPFASMEWLFYGLAKGYRLCENNHYDVIYCHGDPFIAHLVGYILKKRFKMPWVTYIGDPRCFGACSKFKYILKYLEPKCLVYADKVIVNCPQTRDGYIEQFSKLDSRKFCIITDGYDRSSYGMIEPETSDKFRIVYTGVFYKSSREPYEFFKALGKLNDRQIEVVIAGTVSDSHRQYVQDLGLSEKVIFLGHQPYTRVVALQNGATILLVVGWSEGYQIPGKVFEYVAAHRPILVLSGDDKDVASRFVTEYSRGVVVQNNSDQIAAVLDELYALWNRNELDSRFDLSEVDKFNWSNPAQDLEQVMLEVVTG